MFRTNLHVSLGRWPKLETMGELKWSGGNWSGQWTMLKSAAFSFYGCVPIIDSKPSGSAGTTQFRCILPVHLNRENAPGRLVEWLGNVEVRACWRVSGSCGWLGV